MEDWTFWIHLFGTITFAVTGVLAVAPKGVDLFGATVFGIITAVGGGTVRDIIMDVPVFWADEQNYIWLAAISSVVTFYMNVNLSKKKINRWFLFLDASGIALFGIEAVDKVWNLGFAHPIGPVALGVITAIGGGLIRDVLAGRTTLLMTRELYAIPVMFGCTFYVLILEFLPKFSGIGSLLCIAFIFIIRVLAIRNDLLVPNWLTINTKNTQS